MTAEHPEERAFGKYRIQEEIGRGGFGTVFRALDTTLDRPVALKILDPLLMRDHAWAGRFRREARVMARLDHPHIVPIFEIGSLEGRLFLVMKLIDGPNLAERIGRQGTFSWEETLEITDQLAGAIDYAHSEGLVHRDLKPGNVLLANGSAVLTDFGLSRLASDNSISVSMTGGVIGTPAYIAPESWEGQDVTGRADQYALACLVSEMLTGEILFAGKTPPEIMMAHFKPPNFPEEWPDGVPAGVEKVLQTAFTRDPADRFESCRALVNALWELEQDVLAGPYAELEKAVGEQRWENALDLADKIRARDDNYRDIRALEQRAKKGQAAAAAQWREEAKAARAAGNLEIARMAGRKRQALSGEDNAGIYDKKFSVSSFLNTYQLNRLRILTIGLLLFIAISRFLNVSQEKSTLFILLSFLDGMVYLVFLVAMYFAQPLAEFRSKIRWALVAYLLGAFIISTLAVAFGVLVIESTFFFSIVLFVEILLLFLLLSENFQ